MLQGLSCPGSARVHISRSVKPASLKHLSLRNPEDRQDCDILAVCTASIFAFAGKNIPRSFAWNRQFPHRIIAICPKSLLNLLEMSQVVEDSQLS